MTAPQTYVAKSGWCQDATSGHFPTLAEQMHQTCGERLADPVKKPDRCGCSCHQAVDHD